MLVLVSDGVHKHVRPEAIARMMRENAPLVSRCLLLVEAGRINGSEDDATVLVIHRRAQPRARLLRHGASLVAMLVAATLLFAWSFPAGGALPPPSSPPGSPVQAEGSR
jgi:8-oxo-dGTP pyrophosphatase MutT (NUDIX family)